MKRRAIISILIVLALCVGVFAACATQFDDDTLKVAITNLERDMLSTTQTPQSYPLSRVIENSYDAKGNLATIYVKWTIEDSNLITISDDGDKTVTVNIPAERAADIPYKLRATLVDEKGTAYEKADGQNYTAVSSRVAPKSNGGDGGGGQGGGGGTTTGQGTEASPYTPSQANEVGEALASNAYTATAVYVRGYVVAHNDYNNKATPFKGEEGDWRFYIADDVNGTGAFFVNFATSQVTITELNPGDLVTVYGYIENFNGAQMYGKTDPPKPAITAYTAGSGGGQGGGGGTTTGQGTEASPYTVADALAVIQALPQGEQSTQLSYVQGKITGEIKTGDHNELLFTITDNGTGDGITVWYAPAVQCQTGDTVVVKGYLWNFYNQTTSSSTAEIADNNSGVGLAIVKVNGQAPSGGGQGGGQSQWSADIGTYNLVYFDWDTEEYTYTDTVTVEIQENSIKITKNGSSQTITDIEFYADEEDSQGYYYDLFLFTWNNLECELTVYNDDGYSELYVGDIENYDFYDNYEEIYGEYVPDEPSDDWSDYNGTTYNLVDIEDAQIPLKIEIAAEGVTITYNNGAAETIAAADVTFYAEQEDEAGDIYDEFMFDWDEDIYILEIYPSDGFVIMQGILSGYYYVEEQYANVDPTPNNDWSAHVGSSFTLVAYDFENEEYITTDSVTVTINADNITITKGEETTTINDIAYFVEGVSYLSAYDEFDFTWNNQECVLCVYEDDYVELSVGATAFYDSGYESNPDVGGGNDLDDVESDGTLSTDWSDHYGTYNLVAYDIYSEAYDYIPDDTAQIKIDASGITITQNGKTGIITPENLKYFVGETIHYSDGSEEVVDCFYFMWNDELCYVDFYDDGYVDFANYDYTFAYDNDYEGDIGGGDVGGEIVPGSTVTIEFSDQGYSNEQEVQSFTAGGLTFKFTGDATPAKWFDKGTAIRVYGGGSMTVSGAKMTKIELILGSGGDSNTITTNVGTYSNQVWTGSADSVTFNVGGTSGHRRIAGIIVTFDGGSSQGGGQGGGGDQGGGGSGEVVVPEGALLFDFEKNFSSYKSDWEGGENTYEERTISSASLGIQSTVEFVLSNAGVQTSTISTMPVLASKEGAPQYVTVNGNGAKIKSVTFNLKEWIPGGGSTAYKKFTKVQIEYQIGDGAWTVVDGVGFSGEAQRITDHQTLSSGTLPEGVTSVRLVYVSYTDATTKGNQQMGLKSIVLELAE